MTITLEHLKARKKGLGGSDAAAVFGLSKWSTRLDIFFDKITDEIEIDALTPQQEWGNRLEPLIRDKFIEVTGLEVTTPTETFKHPIYPFMLANIDGFIPSENAVLECKSAMYAGEWGESGSDQIPTEYLFQCAHYAEVLNVNKVYIAVLIGGNDFRIYTYLRNHKLGETLIRKEKAFWEEHVLARVPPEPHNTKDMQKLWALANPGTAKEVTPELSETIIELQKIKAQMKTLGTLYDSKVGEIYKHLQEAETLTDSYGNPIATWKTQQTQRLDLNALKVAKPELFEQYKKVTQSRVLRIKGEKE